MKLLISAKIFERYFNSGMCQMELVPMADKNNCAGVEFRSYWRSPLDELPEIKEFLVDYNLVCTYACHEILLHETDEEARHSFIRIKKSLDFAERVGAVLLSLNVAAGDFDRRMIHEAWWQEAVRDILAYAAARGIVVSIENPAYADSGDPNFIREIINIINSPNLRVTFDTANWLAAGYDAEEAMEILMPFIAYVHLKDIVQGKDGFEISHLGSGVVDVKGLIGQLEKRGFHGLCALVFPGGSSPARRIQSSLQYLNLNGD